MFKTIAQISAETGLPEAEAKELLLHGLIVTVVRSNKVFLAASEELLRATNELSPRHAHELYSVLSLFPEVMESLCTQLELLQAFPDEWNTRL